MLQVALCPINKLPFVSYATKEQEGNLCEIYMVPRADDIHRLYHTGKRMLEW